MKKRLISSAAFVYEVRSNVNLVFDLFDDFSG